MIISPLFLVGIFLAACADWHQPSYGSISYPPWAHTIGWVLPLVSVIQIPFWLIIMLLVSIMEGGFGCWSTFQPTNSWLERRNEANTTFIYKPDQSIHSIDSFKPFMNCTKNTNCTCLSDNSVSVGTTTLPLPAPGGRSGMDCSTAKKAAPLPPQQLQEVCVDGDSAVAGLDKLTYQYFSED